MLLVANRREIAANRFVVEADGHQSGLGRDAKILREAPTHELAVARRHQKPRGLERRGSPDERLQVLVRFADGVARPTHAGGVAADPAQALDHARATPGYRVAELPIAVMAVGRATQPIAR